MRQVDSCAAEPLSIANLHTLDTFDFCLAAKALCSSNYDKLVKSRIR